MIDRARDDSEKLWQEYAADKNNTALRNELIEKYLFIVRIQVAKLSERIQGAWSIENGDLFSGGTLGLMKAIEGFEPDLGFKFVTYATKPVRGGIFDALRAFDPLSKTYRRRCKKMDKLESGYAHKNLKFPSPEELIENGEEEDEVKRMIESQNLHRIQSLDQLLLSMNHTVPDEDNQRRFILHDEREPLPGHEIMEKECFYEQLNGLPQRQRLMLLMHFGDDTTFDEVARSFGVSPSRISQLYRQAKRILRNKEKLPA